MKTPQEIFEILKQKFGESVIGFADNKLLEFAIEIAPLAIAEVGYFLRDDSELLFDNLILLSALDDMTGKKVTEEDGSFRFEGGTLSVIYHIESTSSRHKIVLKVVVPKENAEIESVAYVWNHANWEEREAFDMIGIKFLNHPNMIRILMPYNWDAGYPLRKDYKNPEFYEGMKVPY